MFLGSQSLSLVPIFKRLFGPSIVIDYVDNNDELDGVIWEKFQNTRFYFN